MFQVVAGGPFPSGLINGTTGAGDAGNLTIDTGRLVVRDGAQASVSTVGAGDAGNLTIRASSVELTGTLADGQFPNDIIGPSLLTTAVGSGATGNGGSIIIKTLELNVLNRATVTASSLGSGAAGNLEVGARFIGLDNQAALTADSVAGEGGNLTLQVQDLLLLRRNSAISATSGTAGAGGNGDRFAPDD